MAAGQRKPEKQWTSEESKSANLDQRLKSLIMFVLPDDQMNSVINYLTTKSTWDDLILYHAGPFDVKESRVMDLNFLFHVATVTKSVVQKWSDADDKDMDPTVATMTRMTGDHPTAVDKTKLENWNSRKACFIEHGRVQKPVQHCSNKHFWSKKCTRAVISLATFIASIEGSALKRLAQQRREQMKDRSVDVKKINSDLEVMVQNGDDVRSFDLTHLSDCCSKIGINLSIADIHMQKCEYLHLLILLVVYFYLTAFGLKVDISKEDWKETSSVSPLESRSAKNKSYRESHKKNRRDEDKATTYATQAVSFILCGIMESEPGVTIIVVDESKPIDQTVGSSSYCAFKMHTTSFWFKNDGQNGLCQW
ncbi:hypothetical protein Tco_0228741 [Tanacetum coccineum]